MKVHHVIADKPPEVLFADWNYMVQQLPAAASDPMFRYAVLPRTSNARSLGAQTSCLKEGNNIAIELRITIQDDVTVRTGFGESLTQLLDDPFGSRMRGDVEMLDPSVVRAQ